MLSFIFLSSGLYQDFENLTTEEQYQIFGAAAAAAQANQQGQNQDQQSQQDRRRQEEQDQTRSQRNLESWIKSQLRSAWRPWT